MFHGLQPIECILIIFLVLLFNRDECDNVESRILVISKSAFSHHMQMFDTGREKKKLDVLEPGKGKRVDNLDGVVVDHL